MIGNEMGAHGASDEGPSETTPIDPSDLKSSKGWMALIATGEKAFDTWQRKSDSVDKQYANLDRLAAISRDREFQLFWANIQVLGPSVYSRPPVPVVVPRFKDQRPLPRTASELLERAAVVTYDTQDIDGVMRLVRDDLNTVARGVIWVRYETKSDNGNLGQTCCIEHVHRKDFLHDPARNWYEVDWVAKRSWLTKTEARKRFSKASGNLYRDAAYEVQKDETTDQTDNVRKAGFWELWSRSQNKVVWVAEGCDKVLDEGKPHLELEGFFPCPRPAYATTQRSTLIPVPDMLFYKDQLEEINELTARISALSESLRLKGFYPGGASELSDAIEAAFTKVSDNAILVPVSNWALLGNGKAGDMIVWIPLDKVAKTITELVALRKQLIEDIYQIMGLSDIMRGQTEASETLGAQQLKSQYGSVRIRDKQNELVRIARDVTRICAEIMAENFTGKSLLDMSQMDIPSDADIAKQVRESKAAFRQQIADAQSDPQLMQQAEAQPDKAQQVIQQAAQQQAQQLQQMEATVTIEDVVKFLRDNRTRVFVLDIETDSTIAPDENAQAERMTKYVAGMTGLIQQLVPAVQTVPQIAPLAAEVIKKVNSVFRVGREFEGVVETFTEQMKQLAAQPKQEGPTPEQLKAQSEAAKGQLAAQQMQIDAQKSQSDAQLAQAELALQQQTVRAEQQLAAAKLQGEQQAKAAQIEADKWKAQLDAVTKIKVAMISAQTDMERTSLEGELEAMLGIQSHAQEMQKLDAEHEHNEHMKSSDQTHQANMQERSGEQAMEMAGASEEEGDD